MTEMGTALCDPRLTGTLRRLLADVDAATASLDAAKDALKAAREALEVRQANLLAWCRAVIDPQASLPGMAATVDRTTGELMEGTPHAPVQ